MPDTKPASRPVSLPSLRYVGPGYLNDIPARDLSSDDLESLSAKPYVKRRLAASAKGLADLLVSTGLYELNKPSTDGKE
jgi:hypothetical protein